MKRSTFTIFNEWLNTCPYGDYTTGGMDYNPKTKMWEVSFKVPNVSKTLKDSYTPFEYQNQ